MTKLKLDTSNEWWQSIKNDMNSGKFNFTKNYWQDLATDLLDIPLVAPELPEITVTPSAKDKQDLKTVQTGIPDAETRQNVLNLLQGRLQNDVSFNDAAVKLSEVYSKSGYPKVYSRGSISGALTGMNKDKRAHINTLTNRMYNINSWDDFIAELAHAYNNKNIKEQGYNGFFGSLSAAKSGTESVYDRPYNLEYTTHNYTEPLLNSYITEGYSPAEGLKTINGDIQHFVQQDKQLYKYPKIQNAVESFKDLFRKHGGTINYLNFFK